MANVLRQNVLKQINSGAVHKVRHAIFSQFSPPCPTLSHTPPPPKVTHLGPPPIFNRPSTKIPDKSLLYKFSLNCSRGLLSGSFVREYFVWKVLSGMVFVHSPFCQNTSVTTES